MDLDEYFKNTLKEKTVLENTSDEKYNISNILGSDDLSKIGDIIAPDNKYKKTYLSLSRFNALRQSNDGKYITWGITTTKNYQKGYAFLSSDVKKIHSIKMYNFVISDIIAEKQRIAQIPYTILIQELQYDSFKTLDSSRNFHFIGRPHEVQYQYDYILEPLYVLDGVDTDTLIRYNSIAFDKGMDSLDTTEIRMNYNNNGVYNFKYPITNVLQEITLSVGFPFAPIVFNPYSFTIVDADYYGAPDFLYDLTITGLPAFITSGDYYFNGYVRDFNTDAPVTDAKVIAYINKQTGFPMLYDYAIPDHIQLFISGEKFQELTSYTVTGNVTSGTVYLELLDFKAEFEITYS